MGKRARIAVAPKQSLGQNFLIDDNIARNIVRDLHLEPEEVVIEIGPGQGALTQHLVDRVQNLVAMEIDSRIVDALMKKFGNERVHIHHQDFLEARLSEISQQFQRKLRIVGNIPYHLTSSILFKAFEDYNVVKDLTIMVQREVARRITALPGSKDYGILSVCSRFYGIPKQLFNVSPNCFYPKPKVFSTVIQITMHETLQKHIDIELFRLVVRTSFGKRRKILRNSLKYLPYEDEVLQRIFSETAPMLDRRPEQLTVEEFISLTNTIQHSII